MRIFRGGNFVTASGKQFNLIKAMLPLFFLIEFYLKGAKEIKYNN